MLVRVTKATRRWAAILAGTLYALCVVMPSASVAFGAGGHAAHCFTDEQLGFTHHHGSDFSHGQVDAQVGLHGHTPPQLPAHVHADGSQHRHDADHHPATADGDEGPAACCGLFGLTAMAVDPHLDLGAPTRHSSILPISLQELNGRGPERINRPPIALLTL
jgi:hypothetical protein